MPNRNRHYKIFTAGSKHCHTVVGLHSCDVQIEKGVPDVIVPEVSEFEQSNETQAPEVLWLIRYDHNS